MPDTDQIAAINFARLWVDDEKNRHNSIMLDYQEKAYEQDPVWIPSDLQAREILSIRLLCQHGDTDFFGCIVGGCTLLFKSEQERGLHQDYHLRQVNLPGAPVPSPVPAPVPASTPRQASGRAYECFGCGVVITGYQALMAHKPSCPKTKSGSSSSARTYKGGYHNAFYTCFNCKYFTSDLDRVKAHAAAGCTSRHPNDEVGYDSTLSPSVGSSPLSGPGYTTLSGGVGFLYTEHGWEKMTDVAAKLDPAYNGAKATPAPTVVPQAPVPQPANDIDLNSLPNGRYASIAVDGRVWFFYLRRRRNASDRGWGRWSRPAGTIEVSRYESDNLQLVGWQRPGENYQADRGYASHDDDLKYILASPAASAKLYALENTRCYVCGKMLTDPDSMRRGIGPDCLAQGKGFQQHR